jgi:hypothetical protein
MAGLFVTGRPGYLLRGSTGDDRLLVLAHELPSAQNDFAVVFQALRCLSQGAAVLQLLDEGGALPARQKASKELQADERGIIYFRRFSDQRHCREDNQGTFWTGYVPGSSRLSGTVQTAPPNPQQQARVVKAATADFVKVDVAVQNLVLPNGTTQSIWLKASCASPAARTCNLAASHLACLAVLWPLGGTPGSFPLSYH